jgi:O-antigen ligase
MAFALFILLNLTLFVRPAEVVPALAGLPLYNVLMVACVMTSFGRMLGELKPAALRRQPITVCHLTLLAAVPLSDAARLDFYRARELGVEFAKVVIYYLLLLAVLSTPGRLSRFLVWLIGLLVVLTALALLQYHGYVEIPSLTALERVEIDPVTGDAVVERQLRSVGIYNDPNDLCLVLVVGTVFALGRAGDRGSGRLRLAWLAPCGLFLYAIAQTRSRGGFLALLASLTTLLVSRFGWGKAAALAVPVLPALSLFAGGRQTQVSVGQGTAQERIHLWNQGFGYLARNPLTGIGAGMYPEHMGLVAHNSFVHAYVELGVVGGGAFVSAFYLAGWALTRLNPRRVDFYDARMEALRPPLLAVVVGYAVGLMSISRCYIVPTHMVVGLVAAYLQSVDVGPPDAIPQTDSRTAARLAVVGAAVLAGLYVFTKFAVQRG